MCICIYIYIFVYSCYLFIVSFFIFICIYIYNHEGTPAEEAGGGRDEDRGEDLFLKKENRQLCCFIFYFFHFI